MPSFAHDNEVAGKGVIFGHKLKSPRTVLQVGITGCLHRCWVPTVHWVVVWSTIHAAMLCAAEHRLPNASR